MFVLYVFASVLCGVFAQVYLYYISVCVCCVFGAGICVSCCGFDIVYVCLLVVCGV